MDGTYPEPDGEGHQVDPRFLLANERTFLAWNRTALALIAAGVAATQLLERSESRAIASVLGLPLVLLGAVVGHLGYRRWRQVEGSLLEGARLPPARLPVFLTTAIVVSAAVGAILVTLGPL